MSRDTFIDKDPRDYSFEEACAWAEREMFFQERRENSFLYMKHLHGEDELLNQVIIGISLGDWSYN